MTIPTLSTPPATPQRLTDTPGQFVLAMDQWLTYEAGLSAELNTWATEVGAVVSGVDFNGNSTTSLLIGTGSKAFTANTGKLWQVGQFVIAASAADVANYMIGQVTAYNSGTGALTVNVTSTGGAGTLADWAISLAPAPGTFITAAGAATLTNKTISLTSNTFSGTTAEFNAALSDGSFATLAGTETLTGKTFALGNNTLSGSVAEFNAALTGADFATLAGTETLTGKTVNLASNTLSGTIAQFNAALSDGDFATLAGTETLTGKTINLTSNTLVSTLAQLNAAVSDADVATLAGAETLTNKTLTAPAITDPVITGCITEDIYTISDGAAFEIDPGNGSIQRVTLGANRTPKATNMANGESVLLLVADGTAYTITWTDATFGGSGVAWLGPSSGGGVAPTLGTTGLTWIVLTKYSGQVYGQLAGYSA